MKIKYLLLLCSLSGCSLFVPDMSVEKHTEKRLKLDGITVEWYSRSAAYVETPDRVTVEMNDRLDTVISAQNIASLVLTAPDTITIGCYGPPKLYEQPVYLTKKLYKNYNIIIDSTYKKAM